MIKKRTAIGNSLGLIIERPILEPLDIDKEPPLEVRTDGEALIIRPQRKNRSARVKAPAERVMEAHDQTRFEEVVYHDDFKKLPDGASPSDRAT